MTDKFSLKNHPEIAQEIGFLVMVCCNVESSLPSAFTELLRGKADVAYAIVSRTNGISSQFEMLVDIAKTKAGVPLANAIISTAGEVRSAIRFRNQIAHGLYSPGEDGNLSLFPFLYAANRPTPKEIKLSVKLIRRHTDNLGKFIKTVADLSSQEALMIVVRERS